MLKRIAIFSLVLGLLIVGVAAVSAQQGGNGNGRGGNGGENADAPNGTASPDGCTDEPQNNDYEYGGIGIFGQENGNGASGQQGQRGRGGNAGIYSSLPPATEGELPEEIIELMSEGWLDEAHALAVYQAVLAQFGDVAPFSNILRAEEQHQAAWEFMFERYGLTLPETPEFDIPEFASLQDACAAAVDAEIANFGLYDEMLETFEAYPDIYQVALALRNASEFNHLPAFENCAG